MQKITYFLVAVFVALTPFISTAANANDNEIKGLLQNISALVSEIDDLLAYINQSGAYAGIVAGVTNISLSETVIDNTSSQTKKSGTWCTSAALNFYGSDSIYSCGSGPDIFQWIPSFQESAKYEVFMWWTSHPNRSTVGLVQIEEESGSDATQKRVNQQIDGGKWNSLGVYTFGPGTGTRADGGSVKISDQYGQVAADAVKFVKIEATPAVTYSKLSVPTNTLSNGTNIIYRFAVHSNTGDGTLNNTAFKVKVLGADASNPVLYVYADSAFLLASHSPVAGVFIDEYSVEFNAQEPINLPGGSTRYFEIRLDIANKTDGATVSSYPIFTSLPTETLSSLGGTIVPSITVLSPNGGEVWPVGSTQTITWKTSNFPIASMVYIELRPDSFNVSPVTKIAVVPSINGYYSWQVPSSIIPGQYIIEIYKADQNGIIDPSESAKDISDAPFMIAASTLPPTSTLGTDVYYIEDDGTILQSNGYINFTSLSRKFYESYPDKYDFLTFYPTFVDSAAPNYYLGVKNDVKGIGLSVFDNTSAYGSTGKLRGISIVRNFGYQTTIHETAHQFLAYVPGYGATHWDQFIDLSFADGTYTYVNSPMGAAMGPWVDNGNGTFSEDPSKIPYRFSGGSGGPVERFNDSELYLMGLMSKSEVKPLYRLIPTGSMQIVDGKKTYAGYKTPVPVEQLITAAGSERNPAYPSAPKDFTMAFIVLTKKGEAIRGDYITEVNRIAKNFSAEWSFATRGKSTMNGISAPPPPQAPTISLSTSPLSITSGQSSTLSWTSTDATSCTASGTWSGAKTVSGTQSATPTVTSTYTLTCTGGGGSATQSATVTVIASPPPPPPSTGDIIIDNGATGTSKTGSWCVSSASGFYGTNSLYSCGLNTPDTYRWSPSLPGTTYDTYEVSMWWTQHANRSTNVPVKILANIGGVQIPSTVYVNQQINGGKWNSLGTFLLGAGSYVEVSDKNGQANADAVKFARKNIATSGKLDVSLATTPAPQAIVRGTNAVHFVTIVYNTSFSSEDVRILSQGVTLQPGDGAQASDLNTCQVFDGTIPLTTGANILSPGNATPNQAVALQFTFDAHLIVPRESVKKVDVKCNVSNSPLDNETFQIGLSSGASNVTSDTYAFGRTSGSSIAETVAFNSGPIMTVKTTGMLAVSRDASSPAPRYGVGGSADLTAVVLKFHAANEAIKLTKIRVVLGKSAKNMDIVKYTLWDGATKVGEGIFAGTDTTSLATLVGDFIIPKDGDKLLTLKVDLANVGTGQPGTAGDVITIGHAAGDPTGTSGIGQSSGNEITVSLPSPIMSAGLTLVKSYPTLIRLPVPTNTLVNGTMTLYRFSASANAAGDVGLYKVTFKISSSTSAVISNFNLYGYSDSGFSVQAYSANPVNWGAASRQTDGTVEIYFNPLRVGANTSVQIPASATRYFELRGTVSSAVAGNVVSVSLEGDEGFMLLDSAYNIDNPVSVLFPQDDFIWSGNTFTTSGVSALDWTNGYAIPGLPSGGMAPQVFSK